MFCLKKNEWTALIIHDRRSGKFERASPLNKLLIREKWAFFGPPALVKLVTQLTEENEDLRKTIDKKAANLYWKMKEELTHRGKNFTHVGDKSSNGDI